jgi:hypothetical protein
LSTATCGCVVNDVNTDSLERPRLYLPSSPIQLTDARTQKLSTHYSDLPTPGEQQLSFSAYASSPLSTPQRMPRHRRLARRWLISESQHIAWEYRGGLLAAYRGDLLFMETLHVSIHICSHFSSYRAKCRIIKNYQPPVLFVFEITLHAPWMSRSRLCQLVMAPMIDCVVAVCQLGSGFPCIYTGDAGT